MKKRIKNYFTRRLNKKMDQETVGECKYFKLATGKFVWKTDDDIVFDSQFELFEFISNSEDLQKKVIAKKDVAK